MIKQFKQRIYFLHVSFLLVAKGCALSFYCCYIFLPQVQTLNFGDVLFGSSRWTNMSKHLIFRGSCEYECYHPYFVNIITKFGITPQVFALTVPIAKARLSLSRHANHVLSFFVFNFDFDFIFIFVLLKSKVRHHDGCGQVPASREEGGNKPQPPAGETGRVHVQFGNI